MSRPLLSHSDPDRLTTVQSSTVTLPSASPPAPSPISGRSGWPSMGCWRFDPYWCSTCCVGRACREQSTNINRGRDSLQHRHGGTEGVCPADPLVFVRNVPSQRDGRGDAPEARDEAASGHDVVPPFLPRLGRQPRVTLQPTAL